MSSDLHTPVTAGPSPGDATGSFAHDSHGTGALPIDPAERPELLVGAAFAGGLVAALILKRLGR